MICRLIVLLAIAAALSAAEKPGSYSFRRVEESRAPQNRGEWITVGWYSESAGPDKFASRRVSVVGGQVQGDDRGATTDDAGSRSRTWLESVPNGFPQTPPSVTAATGT